METVIIGATTILGLYLAWTIGANDFANSMGAAVGSGALTVRRAIVLGALCELAGSSLAGSHVTDTIRKGIVDPNLFSSAPEILVLGMICALLGTALWLHLATLFGTPVSTTHAIVGAVAGFGIAAFGFDSVEWGKLGSIVASWIISPLAGGVGAFVLFKIFVRFILGTEKPMREAVRFTPVVVFFVVFIVLYSILVKTDSPLLNRFLAGPSSAKGFYVSIGSGLLCSAISGLAVRRYSTTHGNPTLSEQLTLVERIFAPLVVMTSCTVAFAHGANDVANAMGPVAAVFDILRTGTVKMSVAVPFWILALGGIGIAGGLSTFGYRVMYTIGTKITQLTPTRGVAADLSTATTVLVFTLLKIPVSTTHTIVGAIIGIGMARGLGALNRRVTRDIFGSWLVTVPASGLLTLLLFLLAKLLHAQAFIVRVLP